MKKGFTLIELLVVIAIIGILASVVLVSFPGATKKAKDARIISAISQSRTIMEYVCVSEGCSAFTRTHADMVTLIADIDKNSTGSAVINDSGDSACISAPLNATVQGGFYCADRTGVAGYTVSACPDAGECPTVTAP